MKNQTLFLMFPIFDKMACQSNENIYNVDFASHYKRMFLLDSFNVINPISHITQVLVNNLYAEENGQRTSLEQHIT